MVKLSLLAAFAVVLPAMIHAGKTFEYKTLDYDYAFDEEPNDPRSLIMMIPDGTGPNIFALARTVLDPTLKTRLHIDPLLMGQIQTHSSTSYITDSASSATAYSTGYKTYDRGIGVDHFQQPLGTILEAAKARGMITGMIVTSRVTHATPASFASHVTERDNEDEIARQYVKNKNLDFLLGGGARHFTDAMLGELTGSGYTLVKNYGDLMNYKNANEASGKLRLVGLFHKSHMSYELDRAREAAGSGQQNQGAREPSLPEMVDTILSILKNNPVAKKNGFFMLIEGSRVDHAGHSNDPGTMAREAITFDETVGVVKDFVSNNNNVGLVSAADHGTGGLTLGRDGIYDWRPQDLLKQKMSTEWMMDLLKTTMTKECTAGNTEPCKKSLLAQSVGLLKQFSNVTSINGNMTVTLEKEISKAVDSPKRDLTNVMVELGHMISEPALIGWTTVGHVGTDVDLHCMGPSVLERLCKGLHENTYLNKIMTNFLSLQHRQDVETLRLRNFTTLEYSPKSAHHGVPLS